MNKGAILQPIGKHFAIKVTDSWPDGITVRVEGEHLTFDHKNTGTKMAFNVVESTGDEFIQTDKRGVVICSTMSRFKVIREIKQMELFRL